MLHHSGAKSLTARCIRVGSMLVYASVGLASAISGVAVALQLAPVPPTGEYVPPSGRLVPAAAIAATAMDKPARVAAALPDAVPATAATVPVSAPSAAKVFSPVPPPAAPLDERELTFAWGYAQRHPAAAAREAESHGAATFARARVRTGATVATGGRPAERQHASRKTAGFAPSRLAVQPDDPHQELGYAAPRSANALGIFGRAQSSPGPHHRNPSPPPRA